jgi:hypothetical protein
MFGIPLILSIIPDKLNDRNTIILVCMIWILCWGITVYLWEKKKIDPPIFFKWLSRKWK